MGFRTYKFAVQSAAGNAKAQIDIRAPGKIVGVFLQVINQSPSDASYGYAELSFQNVSQRTTNDAIGVVACLEHAIEAATAASVVTSSESAMIPLPGIPVKIADRLFINTAADSSQNVNVHCIVYVQE